MTYEFYITGNWHHKNRNGLNLISAICPVRDFYNGLDNNKNVVILSNELNMNIIICYLHSITCLFYYLINN